VAMGCGGSTSKGDTSSPSKGTGTGSAGTPSDGPPPGMKPRARRSSVSAECDTSDMSGPYEKVVHPKSAEAETFLKESLKNSILFAHLEEEQIQELVDAFKEDNHAADKHIITQGDMVADNFYCLEKGEVKIEVGGKDVAHKGAGYCFGELALMYSQPRAASIVSLVDCNCWALDRQTFIRILRSTGQDKRKQWFGFLKKVPLLEGLDDESLGKIADVLEPKTFAPGTNVVTQGEDGNHFYIVAEGEADATKNTEGGGPAEVVKSYQAGDYFGEVALMKNQPRLVNVVAKTKCKCLALDREAFERLLGPCEVLEEGIKDYKPLDGGAEGQTEAAPTS